MTSPRIVGNFYASALSADDQRVFSVVAGLEAAVPGVRLDHEVTSERTARQLTDRDDFLRTAASRRDLPFIFTGDENRYAALRGSEQPGILMPGGAALWEVWLSLPVTEGLSRLEDAVGSVARALAAYWGVASPDDVAAIIASQTVYAHLPRPVPLGLPGLLPPARLASAFVPHRLGWINYWSETTAQNLGFPDPVRDGELLTRSRLVDNAWLVRLSDEPLDLDRADHVRVLREAYDRFPAIGRRS